MSQQVEPATQEGSPLQRVDGLPCVDGLLAGKPEPNTQLGLKYSKPVETRLR